MCPELHPATDRICSNWTDFLNTLETALVLWGLKMLISIPDFSMTVLTQLPAVSHETAVNSME